MNEINIQLSKKMIRCVIVNTHTGSPKDTMIQANNVTKDGFTACLHTTGSGYTISYSWLAIGT